MIVPNVTADALRSAPVQILANNATVSAARRNTALGITFWTAGSIEGIQSDAPALVYLDGLTLTVADPLASPTGSIRITLPGLYTTADVPFTATTRSTTLTVPRAGGRTTRVALKRASSKRRAVS